MNLLVYRFFCLFFEKKKMFTLPSFKKNVKDKKKWRMIYKMLSISGKKEQHLAMFFCFSIPVLNRRAWFSGKPVPQLGKNKKNKKLKKKLLVVSYRKKRKPRLLALILHIALLKNFLCQKLKKIKKKKKQKKRLKLESTFCFQMLSFY